MTNWMTAAGIAFIAGGLATLISLRSVLFGGGKRRRDRKSATAERRPAGTKQQLALEGRQVAAGEQSVAAAAPARRDKTGRRHDRPVEKPPSSGGRTAEKSRSSERRVVGEPRPGDRQTGEPVRAVEKPALERRVVERPRRPADNRRRLAERPRAEPASLAETAFLDRVPAADHQNTPRGPRPEHVGRVGADDDPGGLASIGLAAPDDSDLTDEPGFEAGYEPERIADPLADPIGEWLLTASDPADAEPSNAEPPNADTEHAEPENADRPNADLTNADPEHSELEDAEPAHPGLPNPVAVTPGDEKSRPISVRRVDRSDRRHGDRVTGWVRPEYHDHPAEVPSGEYWTPVPMSDLGFEPPEVDPEPSAKGYGWPIPVERLPSVPDYEPATGFDLAPVPAEPTEQVPVWSPDRSVRLPRSWPNRNEKPADNRFLENEPGPRPRRTPDEADERFRPPAVEPERRRPRPRPRPGPVPDNVYVSRHAAEPPGGTG